MSQPSSGAAATHGPSAGEPVDGGASPWGGASRDGAPPPEDAKIACRGLWKVFGPDPDRIVGSDLAELPKAELLERTGCVTAVRDVSFAVHPGEVFVVMGLSGSGKSTLIRCLTRLIEPTTGSIVLDGTDVTEQDEAGLRDIRRTKASMVFQHFGLLPHRRVIDNVSFGLEIQGQDRTSREEKAREVIELVGLAGHEEQYPDELSGGMQQRVGLARALANDPEILLFDEPFSALDPLIRRDMQSEVVRLQAELKKTVIFITHDLLEALKIGDRIAIMRDGVFVQVGTADEVVADPADDYVRDFTRDVPRAQVLTARAILRPTDGECPATSATVPVETLIRDLVPIVADDERPVRIVDEDGEPLGIVERDDVLSAVVGEQGSS